MKTQNDNSESTIVKFHRGRGGRFYNGGHVTFVGCERIDEGSAFDELFLSEDETQWLDSQGKEVGLSVEESETGIGTIDQDGEYDTTTTMHITDCDHSSLAAIAEGRPWNLKDLLVEANYFEDESVIDVLDAFNMLKKAIEEDYRDDTLQSCGIEEITEEEYELYENEYQEEVNGKFYKKI